VVYLGENLLFQYALIQVTEGVPSADSWVSVTHFGLVLRVAIAMLVVFLAMLDEHGRASRSRLAEVNSELEELVARLRRQTWLLHRSVALAVHGPVQSALVSTAMRLASSQRTQASVDDARRRLDQALTAISRQRHEDVSIDDALDDLRGLWQGIVRIDVDIDAAARARLAADTGLRRCVIEVCRESASNAIRHGRARAVAISIVESAGRIEVQVRDDGTGLGSPSSAGLGTAMLNDTCLRWSLRDAEGGGAELIATVV
jgi:glucose-6-phosphate-specific signal transduction histidine kinase